jgi:hypothetical protein
MTGSAIVSQFFPDMCQCLYVFVDVSGTDADADGIFHAWESLDKGKAILKCMFINQNEKPVVRTLLDGCIQTLFQMVADYDFLFVHIFLNLGAKIREKRIKLSLVCK